MWKIAYAEAIQDLLKSCVSFGGGLEVVNEEKWGGNRRKCFYSEMWRNAVEWNGGGGACENLMGLSMCDVMTESVKYILVEYSIPA